MAGSQGSALAIAVSHAGGLGNHCPRNAHSRWHTRGIAGHSRCDRPPRSTSISFATHAMPAADARREAAWRELLAPYLSEYGIDPHEGASGSPREPRSSPRRPKCCRSSEPAKW